MTFVLLVRIKQQLHPVEFLNVDAEEMFPVKFTRLNYVVKVSM